jgi:hAT family C-terminal dimerisation region
MTILAAPATSVPSERIFSSSARTDTTERNRLSPVMMEALQILKFNYRTGVTGFSKQFRDEAGDLETNLFQEMDDADMRNGFRDVLNEEN